MISYKENEHNLDPFGINQLGEDLIFIDHTNYLYIGKNKNILRFPVKQVSLIAQGIYEDD